MGGIFSVLKFKHQTLDTVGNHYISAIHPHPSEVNILQRKDLYRENSEMFILTRRSVPQEDTEVLAKCVCTHQQSFKISGEKSDKAEKKIENPQLEPIPHLQKLIKLLNKKNHIRWRIE